MSNILDTHPLWTASLAIANDARESADTLPEDERWGMVSKMRFYIVEIIGEAAAAVGSIDPRDIKIHLGRIREQLYALKGMYVYGHKADVMELDPEKIVKIEKLVTDIDKRLQEIPSEMEQWYAAQEPPVRSRSES